MNRRTFTKTLTFGFAALVTNVSALFEMGCPGKSTIAALVATLGNATQSIATALGNTVLSEKIKVDTAAAVTAINNWTSGQSSAQIAISVLNTLVADINLLPLSGIYATLVTLALSTASSIISILSAGTPAAMKGAYNAAQLSGAPLNSGDFKKRWNGICAVNPQLAPVHLH